MKLKGIVGLVVWGFVLAFVAAGCSSGSDASDIADALSEKLTDSFNFDGEEVVDESAPKGSSAKDAPQLLEIVAPDTLTIGDMFTVELHSEFADASQIDRAVLYVDGSKRHIRVHARFDTSTGTMILAGHLAVEEKLMGKQFEIYVALGTASGLVGEYKLWNLKISDDQPRLMGEPIDGVVMMGEQWIESGRPAGSQSDDAPQIALLDAPSSLMVDTEYTILIQTSNTVQDVVAVLLSTPGNNGYKRTTEFDVNPVAKDRLEIFVNIQITQPELVGNALVLMFALEGKDASVGMWYPWRFEVIAKSAVDGDEEIEAEEFEPEAEIEESEEDLEPEPEPEPEIEPEEEMIAEPIWQDPATGLVWQNPYSMTPMREDEAENYCGSLSWGGIDQFWRVPTIDELRTLVRGCAPTEYNGSCPIGGQCSFEQCWENDCDGCNFKEGPYDGMGCYMPDELYAESDSKCGLLWSSTMLYADRWWGLDFDSGQIVQLDESGDFPELASVRCVYGEMSISDGDEEGEEEPWIDGDEEFIVEEMEPEPELEPELEEEAEQSRFVPVFDIRRVVQNGEIVKIAGDIDGYVCMHVLNDLQTESITCTRLGESSSTNTGISSGIEVNDLIVQNNSPIIAGNGSNADMFYLDSGTWSPYNTTGGGEYFYENNWISLIRPDVSSGYFYFVDGEANYYYYDYTMETANLLGSPSPDVSDVRDLLVLGGPQKYVYLVTNLNVYYTPDDSTFYIKVSGSDIDSWHISATSQSNVWTIGGHNGMFAISYSTSTLMHRYDTSYEFLAYPNASGIVAVSNGEAYFFVAHNTGADYWEYHVFHALYTGSQWEVEEIPDAPFEYGDRCIGFVRDMVNGKVYLSTQRYIYEILPQ